jgi:hypothetical protein
MVDGLDVRYVRGIEHIDKEDGVNNAAVRQIHTGGRTGQVDTMATT